MKRKNIGDYIELGQGGKEFTNNLKWKEVVIDPRLMSNLTIHGISFIEELINPESINIYNPVGEDKCLSEGEKKKKVKKGTIKKQYSKSIKDSMINIKDKILHPDEYWEEYGYLRESLKNWVDIIEKHTFNFNNVKENECLSDDLRTPNIVIHPSILKGIEKLGFFSPTKIQEMCLIPAIRDRKDIIAAAETGSGKTLAYSIPILVNIMFTEQRRREKLKTRSLKFNSLEDKYINNSIDDTDYFEKILDSNDNENNGEVDDTLETLKELGFKTTEIPEDIQLDKNEFYEIDRPLQALIILPSRELALQVRDHLRAVGQFTGLGIHAFVGGFSIEKQERLIIQNKIQIAVGTPGRLADLILNNYKIEDIGKIELERKMNKILSIEYLRFLVLDEADRLVEQGHYKELKLILDNVYEENGQKKKFRKPIQTYIFSATLNLPDKLHPRFSLKKNNNKHTKYGKNNDQINSDLIGNTGKAMQSILQYVKLQNGKVFVVDLSRFKISYNKDENIDKNYKYVQSTSAIHIPKGLMIYMIRCDELDREMRLIMYLLAYFTPKWNYKLNDDKESNCANCAICNKGKILLFVNSISYVYRLLPLLPLVLLGNDIHLKKLTGNFKRPKCNYNCKDSLKILGIHGNISQKQRVKTLEQFRYSNSAILICTDVLARGLDIPDVEVVIHLQPPRNASLMIHRSGRTARATKTGECVLFCTPKDVPLYTKYLRAISQSYESIAAPYQISNITSFHISHIQNRLALAIEIENLGHLFLKKKKNMNWMIEMAKEADLELSDEEDCRKELNQLVNTQEIKQKYKQLIGLIHSFEI
ncbi:DEAD DEAH box helicase family protein [Cryptosporidium andersoni]|uniref:ATP-dependent RNA helicase n=1 Tax=Cryptosporidium andersoni TaxID=117008 RepID=A0A1J4MSQ7_9CRYT|nr:DEAD DEAH box helicase family protein [Cryptosporidium andersoni]